jgi:hypothetical protein
MNTTLNTLPNDMLNSVLAFLPAQDYLNVRLISKRINAVFEQRPELYARQIYELVLKARRSKNNSMTDSFFTEGSSIFDEVYYQPTDKEYLKFKNAPQLWKKNATQIESLSAFLTETVDDELLSKSVINDFVNAIVHPESPAPILKKDIHHFPTETDYQNFLTEKFYGLGPFNHFSESAQNVKKICKLFASEECCSKDGAALAEVRWFTFESQDSIDGLKAIEKFFYLMQNIVATQCEMVNGYLNSLDGDENLLKEYRHAWEAYVVSIRECEKMFSPLSDMINDVYMAKFPTHPTYPQFSIWRMMAKVWFNQVYELSKERLIEAYSKVYTCSFALSLGKNDKNVCKIVDKLYNEDHADLLAQQEEEEEEESISATSSEETLFGTNGDVLNNSWTDIDSLLSASSKKQSRRESLKSTLNMYRHSIEDLSFNEYTVFFRDCDEFAENTPKQAHSQAIFERSVAICKEVMALLKDTPTNFKKIYDGCKNLVVESLGERSSIELLLELNQHLVDCMNDTTKPANKINYNLMMNFFEKTQDDVVRGLK